MSQADQAFYATTAQVSVTLLIVLAVDMRLDKRLNGDDNAAGVRTTTFDLVLWTMVLVSAVVGVAASTACLAGFLADAKTLAMATTAVSLTSVAALALERLLGARVARGHKWVLARLRLVIPPGFRR